MRKEKGKRRAKGEKKGKRRGRSGHVSSCLHFSLRGDPLWSPEQKPLPLTSNEVALCLQYAGTYISSAFSLVLPSDSSKHNKFAKYCLKPKFTEMQNQQITYTKLIIILARSEKCAVVLSSQEATMKLFTSLQTCMGSNKLTPAPNHIF